MEGNKVFAIKQNDGCEIVVPAAEQRRMSGRPECMLIFDDH
jgi:hypothetical protein